MKILRFYLSWAFLLLLASWVKSELNHPLVNLGLWTCAAILVGLYSKSMTGLKLMLPGLKALSLIAATGALTYIFIIIYFKALGLTHFPTPQTHQNLLSYHWPTWSSYLLIAVIPVILEELSFRSIIYGQLEKKYNSRVANIIQAMLYALLHLRPAMILSHFFLGLFFGFARQRTGSIYLGLLIHIFWNSWALYRAGDPLF